MISRRALTAVLLHLVAAALAGDAHPASAAAPRSYGAWPEGTRVLPAENLEGVLLLRASLHGFGRDTAGVLVLDSGAGFLALDRALAVRLGVADSGASVTDVDLAPRALPRLELGGIQIDQVSPVLVIDAAVVDRVIDRDVLGLIGERPLSPYIVWIDYDAGRVTLVPGGTGAVEHDATASRLALPALSARARALPFRLAGDGKILVRARLSDPRRRASSVLTLVLDTGATKTVLFEPALSRLAPWSASWPSMRGLVTPTLLGVDPARVVRVPLLEVEGRGSAVRERGLDAAVMESDLSGVLERAVGEPVHGLLGYSFLRHYRIAIDYPRRLVWLDPLSRARDPRAFEFSQPGLQVERHQGAMRVVAVVERSPAAEAGILAGDDVLEVDGIDASTLDVVTLMRRLEGPPGSRVTLVLERGGQRRNVTLVRRMLL